jgi:uncharacterized membrane protein
MKINRKLVIVIAALSLTAAGILGGIFFQFSRKGTPDGGIEQAISHPAGKLLVLSVVIGAAVIVLITVAVFIMARDSGREEPVRQAEEANEIGAIEQLIANINDLSVEINRQAKDISQSMTVIRQTLANIQTAARDTDGEKALFNRAQGEALNHVTLTKQIQNKYGDRN